MTDLGTELHMADEMIALGTNPKPVPNPPSKLATTNSKPQGQNEAATRDKKKYKGENPQTLETLPKAESTTKKGKSSKSLPPKPNKEGDPPSKARSASASAETSKVTPYASSEDLGQYKKYDKDETVKFISRPYEMLPPRIQDKIQNNGIDPATVTGKNLDYLWHVAWFLNRKDFESGFVCYERTKDQAPNLSEEILRDTKKKINNFNGVPIKKIFPSLEYSAEGGFGQVFTGKMFNEKKKKIRVAIKKLPNAPENQKANLAELYFLSTISHPNIVKFLCCYSCPGDPKGKTPLDQMDHLMFVMEWLEGGTLNQAANSGGRFEDHHVAFVARECFKGIAYLHERNFVHRDLKSSNVMLSTLGEVKIIDFGLCLDLSAGRRNRMLGSPMWIPPEMIHCRPHGTPSDVWSMGVCILELLIGGPPLKKTPIKCMYTAATLGLAHLIPTTATANAQNFLASCLTVNPDNRPSAAELLKHPWVSTQTDLSRGIQTVLKQVFLVKNLSNMGF